MHNGWLYLGSPRLVPTLSPGVSTGKDTLSLFASPIAVLQCSVEFSFEDL